MEKAIALLEVQAMVTAIVGLDAMIKAADVKLIHVEKRLGGRLVTVVVEGSVSAVQAAADAGKAAAAEQVDAVCGNSVGCGCYLDYGKYQGNGVSDSISPCIFYHRNLRRGASCKSGKTRIFAVEEDSA